MYNKPKVYLDNISFIIYAYYICYVAAQSTRLQYNTFISAYIYLSISNMCGLQTQLYQYINILTDDRQIILQILIYLLHCDCSKDHWRP